MQVRREIEVAEVEPGSLRAEGPQLLGGAERLLAPTPPAFAVEDVAEPVGDGVGVGGDAQAVDVVVVGHVHDHGEVVPGHHADEPRRNLPAPMPPASATTFIAVQRSRLADMPEGTPHRLRRALARAEAGKTLALDEAEALLQARGPDLERLMELAARLRDLGHGDVVTYSRKVFIPLTMLCRDHCHYCTFAKPPAKLDAPFLTPEEAVAIAEAGRRWAARRRSSRWGTARRTATPSPRAWLEERGYGSTLDYVRAVAIRVIEETGLLPHLNPGVMSYEELARLKHVSASMGIMLETVVRTAVRQGRPALRLARQGAGRAAAHDRGRRPPGDPVHHGHPRGDRRDRERARRVPPRDPRRASPIPPRAGGHRPELPREARHGDAATPRSRVPTSSSRRSPRHGSSSAPGRTSRPRPT